MKEGFSAPKPTPEAETDNAETTVDTTQITEGQDSEQPEKMTRRGFLKKTIELAAGAAALNVLGAEKVEAGSDCDTECKQRLEAEIKKQNAQIDKYADLSNLSKEQCDEYGRQRHKYAANCARLKKIDPSNELCAKCARQQKFYDETVWNVCKHYYE